MKREPTTPKEQVIADFLRDMLKDNNIAGVVLLEQFKDGSVKHYGGSRVIQPREAFETMGKHLAALLQEMFQRVQEAGQNCNCPKCIEARGAVVSTHGPKAEA